MNDQSIDYGIGLFVYARPEHTKRVLEGLRQNKVKHLYVFLDAAKSAERIDEVDKVRKIIKMVDWCTVELVEQAENKGLDASILFGVEYMFKRHDKIIVLEDDCVPMPSFVSFFEQCFKKYENDARVMNINGYCLPIRTPKDITDDAYFTYRSLSWGWGTWLRAWKLYSNNKNIYLDMIKSEALQKKIERGGQDLIPALKDNYDGLCNTWDIYWTVSILLNDGFSINPAKSLINCIGLDGSGVHCGISNLPLPKYYKEPDKLFKLPATVCVNKKIEKRTYQFSYGRIELWWWSYFINRAIARIKRMFK